MNKYTDKNGLKKAQVEYGWGMEMEATLFPVELATRGIKLGMLYMQNAKKLRGNMNEPEVAQMISYCSDIIENAKKGESTYVIDEFFAMEMETMARLIKMLDKAINSKTLDNASA